MTLFSKTFIMRQGRQEGAGGSSSGKYGYVNKNMKLLKDKHIATQESQPENNNQ